MSETGVYVRDRVPLNRLAITFGTQVSGAHGVCDLGPLQRLFWGSL